jgi:hypothetical protein
MEGFIFWTAFVLLPVSIFVLKTTGVRAILAVPYIVLAQAFWVSGTPYIYLGVAPAFATIHRLLFEIWDVL